MFLSAFGLSHSSYSEVIFREDEEEAAGGGGGEVAGCGGQGVKSTNALSYRRSTGRRGVPATCFTVGVGV